MSADQRRVIRPQIDIMTLGFCIYHRVEGDISSYSVMLGPCHGTGTVKVLRSFSHAYRYTIQSRAYVKVLIITHTLFFYTVLPCPCVPCQYVKAPLV